MLLDRKKITYKYTREHHREAPPICGLCGKRFTVAELLSEQFEAVQGKSGPLAFYHRACTRMEAGGHD